MKCAPWRRKAIRPRSPRNSAKLEARAEKALADLYASLTPWQKTLVARAQGRPRFGDYVKGLITEFTPLAGDRYFGEDEAIVGGLGRFEGESVCVIGQEKGDDTASRVRHNFGMARPGRLSQGDAPHAACRPFRPAGDFPHRHRGRLPGRRGRRARPGRSHRALDRHLSLDRRAQRRSGDRRGRLGRRARDRRLQHRAHARTRHLYRGLARSGRLDPLAQFLARAGSGDGHEDHRPGPDQVRHHRRNHSRAARRRAPRSGRDDRLRRARAQRRAQVAAQSGSGRTSQRAGGEVSWRWDGRSDCHCRPARA